VVGGILLDDAAGNLDGIQRGAAAPQNLHARQDALAAVLAGDDHRVRHVITSLLSETFLEAGSFQEGFSFQEGGMEDSMR
jgi:hypothetical protein